MKFVFFETEDWQVEPLKQAFPHDELVFTAEHLTEETVDKYVDADMVSVFVHSKIPNSVLDKFQHLKLIATRSTGYDHIDIEYAKSKQIYVCTVPSYGENTVAEHTFALILALSRKIFQTYERTEEYNFTIDNKIQGWDLKDKTIGVYGLGHIGYYVAKIAHGFSMNIVAYKRTPDQELAEKFGVKFVSSLDELLGQSDVITLHCPLTPETHYLINQGNIDKIKRGAILINTARGGLVETEAVLQALEKGILSGAGLDVFEEEICLVDPVALLNSEFRKLHNLTQILENHLLVARDDVILTPHNAFNSVEAVHRILNTTIENIQKFFAGNSQNVINPTW